MDDDDEVLPVEDWDIVVLSVGDTEEELLFIPHETDDMDGVLDADADGPGAVEVVEDVDEVEEERIEPLDDEEPLGEVEDVIGADDELLVVDVMFGPRGEVEDVLVVVADNGDEGPALSVEDGDCVGVGPLVVDRNEVVDAGLCVLLS